MDIVSQLLPRALKDAATAAFRDNIRREQMSLEEREQAARAYEQLAGVTVGTSAELARLYTLERARFLRGEIDHIAPTAREFVQEASQRDEE